MAGLRRDSVCLSVRGSRTCGLPSDPGRIESWEVSQTEGASGAPGQGEWISEL